MLEPDADAYGDRGSNLLNKLHDLQRERGESLDTAQPVNDRASSLIEDVDKWLEEGRLDPAIGDVAQRLLALLAGG